MGLQQRYGRDIRNAIRRDQLSLHKDGSVEVCHGLRIQGCYVEGIRGIPTSFRRHRNLIPDAGILSILGVYWGAVAKISAWYIAPFSGNVTPAANWTAANFTANATEITSTTEGFSETTRPQFVAGTAAAGQVDNSASKANFTIVCSSTLNIYGAGLLSSNVRGGTAGILSSAVKFTTLRVVNNGDPWQCQYELQLTDS